MVMVEKGQLLDGWLELLAVASKVRIGVELTVMISEEAVSGVQLAKRSVLQGFTGFKFELGHVKMIQGF